MGKVYTEAQKRATEKYVGKTDVLRVRCGKEKKAEIKKFAEANGLQVRDIVLGGVDMFMNINSEK